MNELPFVQDGALPRFVCCGTAGLQAVDWAWRTNIMVCSKSHLIPRDLLLWVCVGGEICRLKSGSDDEMGQQSAALCTKVFKSACV